MDVIRLIPGSCLRGEDTTAHGRRRRPHGRSPHPHDACARTDRSPAGAAVMTTERSPDGSRHWSLWVLGVVIALLGLVLAVGGGWLIALGGSWYYLPAGLGLLVSGVQLVRGRMSGAWWFVAVFIGNVRWSAWEVGLDYWRWIPTLGLMVGLPFVVAPFVPRLQPWPSTTVSRAYGVVRALECGSAWGGESG